MAAAAASVKTAVLQTATTTTRTANSRRGPLFARVQTGLGHVVAQATTPTTTVDNNGTKTTTSTTMPPTTRLTNVSHQAPFRWIPLRSSTVSNAGAAICYASNYGGGMLSGDNFETTVQVQRAARLGILTQGANRVYKQLQPPKLQGINKENEASSSSSSSLSSRVNATYHVDAHGLLVVAPDPLTPFANSALVQNQTIHLDQEANLCFIDWVSAGRLSQGERWQQDVLSSQTTVKINNNNNDGKETRSTVVLKDAVHIQAGTSTTTTTTTMAGMDWATGQLQFNTYATLLLYGPQVQRVRQVCQALPPVLASPFTQTRPLLQQEQQQDDTTSTQQEQEDEESNLLDTLAGPVLMGVTSTPITTTTNASSLSALPNSHNHDLTIVRLAATSNEDIYRVLETCLSPLAETFGHAFYKERIRAARSATVPFVASSIEPTRCETSQQELATSQHRPNSLSSPKALWAAHLLTDSSLPTGGFAHSSGLEAAAQLRLVQSADDITAFCHATVKSTLQLVTPTLMAVHQAVKTNQVVERWPMIHDELHALMVGNGPACRASLDQGISLWRLMARQEEWFSHNKNNKNKLSDEQLKTLDPGHYAAVFGLVTARWGLELEETRYLLAYCIARDVVSAAVRLNLIGPLASVPLLASVYTALDDMDTNRPAASCAPVLEALQPMHDLLAVRLFRT